MPESIADRPLPIASAGQNSTAWLGLLCLIATEGSLFAYLLFSYAYFGVQQPASWLPTTRPSLTYALPGTIVLLSSSGTIWWSEQGMRKGDVRQHLVGLAATIALGIGFAVLEVLDWRSQPFSLSSRAYGSFYFVITGFHMAHVVVGVALLTAVLAWSWTGYFNTRRHIHLTISGAYWHFVDVVWVFVFTTFFIAPHLVGRA